jgi:hypothetical protein
MVARRSAVLHACIGLTIQQAADGRRKICSTRICYMYVSSHRRQHHT